jgi:hypothetical protein
MKLIESKTLGTAAAAIEFTSIPQDGTDLLLFVSARSSASSGVGGAILYFRPNGLTTNQSSRVLLGNGSSTTSFTDTNILARMNPSDWTADTFGNTSFYIPNYANSTTNKSFSIDTVGENNATSSILEITAALWSSTSAITSITLVSGSGNIVAGSTASLYKITKGSDGIVTTS